MSNKENYKKTFIEALSIKQDQFNENMKYNDISEWDSIGHMTLISALEEKFKISIETDDIINFSSFNEGKKILKKYGVNI
jgi:acyl carrier protein|tara:strand:- start:6085 stop:6324 length:240 start_codon:yes stop_codon:yes gene_type:complete